jgi:hypothetical protein
MDVFLILLALILIFFWGIFEWKSFEAEKMRKIEKMNITKSVLKKMYYNEANFLCEKCNKTTIHKKIKNSWVCCLCNKGWEKVVRD